MKTRVVPWFSEHLGLEELLSCYIMPIGTKVRDSGFYERIVDLGLRLERIFETND